MEKVATKVKLGQLTIAGNVQDVLNGVVDDEVLHAVGPNRLRFALGSGTFSDAASVGEAIVIDGKMYVSWVKGKKVHTETRSKISSPFLLGLDAKFQGGTLLQYKPAPAPTLQMFYQDLAQEYPTGVAVIGEVLFEQLQSTYLIKAPIYGENINERSEDYWAKNHIEGQKRLFIFAVIIPEEGSKNYTHDLLGRAFYQNPYETHKSTYFSHTHGAVLDAEPLPHPQKIEDFFDSLHKLHVTSVRHVLTDSFIKEGCFVLVPV